MNTTNIDTTYDVSKIILAKKEWEATVDALPQLICLIDHNGTIIRANRTVERWGLRAVEDVNEQTLHDLLHPICNNPNCQIKLVWDLAKLSLYKGEPFQLEILDDIRDVTYDIAFQSIHNPLLKANRSFASITITDITERKKMEDAVKWHVTQSAILQTIEKELTNNLDVQHVMQIGLNAINTILDTKQSFIALVDDALQLTDFNSSVYTEAEIKELLVSDYAQQCFANVSTQVPYNDDTTDCDQQVLSFVIQSHHQILGLIYIKAKDQNGFDLKNQQLTENILLRFTSALINAQLYEMSHQHVNDLKALNAEISTLEQIKTDMIRLASHDLRNPLASIKLSMDILSRYSREKLSDLQQRHYISILNSVNNMKSIIDDILSLERIEAIHQQQLTLVDIAVIVERVFSNFEPQAHVKALGFNLHQKTNTLMIEGDETVLQEIISNFMSNAIKYTDRGGKVDVYLSVNSNNVTFKIIDTGFGIDKTEQEKIFQPFFRAENAKSSDIAGIGLGLNVTKNMIERLNGTIIFESVLNEGSTFGFSLPLSYEI
ncbi:MAG: ATP-binding protein [Phototrophicaceae bacterium]